jgi:hypothetical protein
MTTCLEDLNASLVLIQQAIEALGGTEAPPVGTQSVSVSAQASSRSSSVSSAIAAAQSSSLALAYAQATAIANVVLSVDVRVETTNIVRLRLPPMTVGGAPPDLVLYPAAETGITDVPTTTADNGELCNLLWYYVTQMEALLHILAEMPVMAQAWVVASVLTVAQIEAAMKLLLQLASSANLAGLLLDASAIVGMAQTLFDAQQNDIEAVGLLLATEQIISDNELLIICTLYNHLVLQEDDALETIKELFVVIGGFTPEPTTHETAMLAWLFNPTILNAAMFVPLVGNIPTALGSCDCGE